MRNIRSGFRDLLEDEIGASTIEMGLIAVMIVLAMMTALSGVASENSRIWNKIHSSSSNANNQSGP